MRTLDVEQFASEHLDEATVAACAVTLAVAVVAVVVVVVVVVVVRGWRAVDRRRRARLVAGSCASLTLTAAPLWLFLIWLQAQDIVLVTS
jgi:hypothetical protein